MAGAPAHGTTRLLMLCGGGALYALAQPGPSLWPLAGICLVPLLATLSGCSVARRAFHGWLYGTVATALATSAAGVAGATSYFGLSVLSGVVVAVALGQVLGAGSFALFAVLAGDPREGSTATAVGRVGCAFAAAELARCTLLSGFPWMLLAYAVAPVPPLTQAAAQGGVLSVSLLLGCLNAALLRAMSRRPIGGALATAAVAAAFGLFATLQPSAPGPGSVSTAGTATPEAGVLRIALVQPGPATADGTMAGGTVASLRRLSELSGTDGIADVVVWPENAVDAVMPTNAHLLRDLPRGENAPERILGAPREARAEPGRIHTAALLFGRDGTLRGHHDKVKLLPFAEYAPWPLEAEDLGILPERPAPAPRVLEGEAARFGPLLCYEVLFADLARTLTRGGAGILLNLSNDGWFGQTAALDQQLAAAVYRAVETRRPLLRATTTGITAAIDAGGRVVAQLPRDTPGVLRVDVTAGAGQTLHTRLGGWVGWAAAALAAGSAVRRAAGARAARRQPASAG